MRRIDEVTYTESWAVLQGYSKQFDIETLEDTNFQHAVENDKFWNWCDSADERTYGYGDHGTPKIDNTVCADVTQPPEEGDVFITEIFADTGFESNNGQWFEIFNTTNKTKELHHCKISSSASEIMIDESLLIGPNEILVLGNTADTFGNVTLDYKFDLFFNPTSDTISLTCYDLPVDDVTYDLEQGWPIATQASLSLIPGIDAVGNDDATNWCYSHDVYFCRFNAFRHTRHGESYLRFRAGRNENNPRRSHVISSLPKVLS